MRLIEADVAKTVWILISWLHQKPADLDLHCFKKSLLEKLHGAHIRSNTVTVVILPFIYCFDSLFLRQEWGFLLPDETNEPA